MRARTILTTMREKGPKDLKCGTFSERTRRGRDPVNDHAEDIIVPPWVSRKTPTDIATNQQAEEHDKADLTPALAPAPSTKLGFGPNVSHL